MDEPHPLLKDATAEIERQIDVGSAPHEPRRHHANDGSRRAVQQKGSADDAVVARELTLPTTEAQHAYIIPAVRLREDAAYQRWYTHDCETVEGCVISL